MVSGPPAEERPGRLCVRIECNKREPATHRRVNQRDRSVSRVHGADEVEVRREREAFVVRGVEKVDGLIPILEQEVELTEDLGEVGAIDLVDDEYEGLIGMLASAVH